MELMLKVDPTNPADIREGISTLERLLAASGPNPALDFIAGAVANEKYGIARLGYLAAVASAGDEGVPVDELMRDHFGGSYHAFGGTHASIEKTWRAKGGEATAPKLIDDSPDGTRQVMTREARGPVLAVIDLQRLRDELRNPAT